MTTTNQKNSEATMATTLPREQEGNLDEYAASVDLPPYAAPIQPSYNFPLLQYGKKVNVVSGRRPTAYTGFLIGVEQDVPLDDRFEQQGVPQVRIRHRNGTEDSYWQLDTVRGYILCTAVPSEYGPDVWKKTGVAYVWNDWKDTYAYGSQFQCLFFLHGLLELGYNKPLVLTLSRTVTQHFVTKVMRRHEATLEAIKAAFKKLGKSHEIAFYSYGVELVKAPEEVTVKNGGTYYPPATTIPSPLTVSYVKQQQTPPNFLSIIEGYIPLLYPWAEATSAMLLEPPRNNDNNGSTPPEESELSEA